MKSINQIFKSNPELMEHPEVKELIEYTQELEGQVMENTQTKQFSFEDKLAELVRDTHTSLKQFEGEEENNKRFGDEFPKPNYEEGTKNLLKYIRDFAIDNKFRL